MTPEHPMYERLQTQLRRKGWRYEDALDEALMSWICDQELKEQLAPRTWYAEQITVENIRWLTYYGPIELHLANGSARIVHQHPMIGPIFVADAKAMDKLQQVQNEVWNGVA